MKSYSKRLSVTVMSVITFHFKIPPLGDTSLDLLVGAARQTTPDLLQCVLEVKKCFGLWL